MKHLSVKYLLLLVLLVPLSGNGQNEHNVWYFSSSDGIDFNSGAAEGLTNSGMTATEGCASICDNAGNILFYTNGESVYNSNHQQMPSGFPLGGETSSSQSAVIVPKPGSNSEYYIFTSGSAENVGAVGIMYSVVDMTLDGGLGDVTAAGNTLVYAPSCEKIAAVQHANGSDYWIVTHEWLSNNYRSYLLTSSGLAATPVISAPGINIGTSGIVSEMVGYLKANMDGDKIAAAHFGKDTTELLDFDNSTGVLSNPLYIPGSEPYGVEFSPESEFLYVTHGASGIYQYNLLAGSQTAIVNSEFNLVNGAIDMAKKHALQLAPDGKIYSAKIGQLGAISNPSQPGFGAGYTANVPLIGSNATSQFGLPASTNKIGFLTQSSQRTICEGDSVLLFPNDFGNHNWALAANPNNVIATTDTLTVSPTVSTDYIVYDGSDTAYFSITVLPSTSVDIGPDIVICEGDSVLLFDYSGLIDSVATFFWLNPITNPPIFLTQDSIWVSTAGTYLLNVFGIECALGDEVQVSFSDTAIYNITAENPICFGTATGSIIVNNDSLVNTVIDITNSAGVQVNNVGTNAANSLLAGLYYINSDSTVGCAITDTVELIEPLEMQLQLSINSPSCFGDDLGTAVVSNIINIQGSSDSISYLWTPNPQNNNGLQADSIWGLTAGSYVLEAIDDFGCTISENFTITEPKPLIGEITTNLPTLCRTTDSQSGNGVLAAIVESETSGTPPINFEWRNLADGQIANTSTVVMRSPGAVVLTITDNNNCTYVDTVILDSLNPIADFEIESNQFTGPAKYEGTEDLTIKITNLSQNFAQANNPNADTIFQWNLYTNQLPSSDQNWFISKDIDDDIDTTYDGEQIYQVCLIAKNYNDCADTLCQDVIVRDFPLLVTPNVFTPGSSPNSHFFFPAEGIQDFNCSVFNRYGILVYEFNNIFDQWDGSHFKSGSPCSDGVYFYVYSALSTNGTPFEGEGQVTLVRD